MGSLITMGMLTVLCVVVLVPQALKAREERHQRFLDSLRFHAPEGLGDPVVRPAPVVHPAPTPRRRSVSPITRRRNVFVFLLTAFAVSAVGAVTAPGKASLVIHLAVADCFLAYVALLVRWRDARMSRTQAPSAPVTNLVLAPPTAHPVLRVG